MSFVRLGKGAQISWLILPSPVQSGSPRNAFPYICFQFKCHTQAKRIPRASGILPVYLSFAIRPVLEQVSGIFCQWSVWEDSMNRMKGVKISVCRRRELGRRGLWGGDVVEDGGKEDSNVVLLWVHCMKDKHFHSEIKISAWAMYKETWRNRDKSDLLIWRGAIEGALMWIHPIYKWAQEPVHKENSGSSQSLVFAFLRTWLSEPSPWYSKRG